MNRTLNFQNSLIIFGIPAVLIGFIVWIAKSPAFRLHPDSLALGITFDLLLTVPLLYFLLIQKTNIPKTTVLPVLVIGLVIGSAILPPENQQYLNFFKIWVLPAVELSIMSLVIYKVWKAVRSYNRNKARVFDFFTTLKTACSEILPRIAIAPVATEIAVLYYGFIHWKKRPLKEHEYSYHKENGTVPLLVAFIFMIAIETAVLHLLLARWNHTAAWILTFLSIYSAIQVFGFLRSMSKRPISIEKDRINLRYGIMNEGSIDLKEIDSIEISSKDIENEAEAVKLSLLGNMESHNLIIRLKTENTLYGLYGTKRKFKVLALYIDNKHTFKDQIDRALQQF